jgi:hypothetical protein
VVWVPNLGPQLPEGKLEDFQVELNLKQPVSSCPVTPVDNFSMEKVFDPEELGSGKNLQFLEIGRDDFHDIFNNRHQFDVISDIMFTRAHFLAVDIPIILVVKRTSQKSIALYSTITPDLLRNLKFENLRLTPQLLFQRCGTVRWNPLWSIPIPKQDRLLKFAVN